MKPYAGDDLVTLFHGDVLTVLRELPADSVDAVVTDPPYGIGFMGHEWDQPGRYAALYARHGGSNVSFGGPPHPAMEAGRYDLSAAANRRFEAWCSAWAAECRRVLKPGGHLLSFGGTRTYHRLTSGIEDAGFEIRDGMQWLYGSGFPKSLDVGKAIDRAAGHERRGYLDYRNGPNTHPGTKGDKFSGGFENTPAPPATAEAASWDGWGTALKPGWEPIVVARRPLDGTVAANVLAYGTGGLNIGGCLVGDEPMITHSRGANTAFPKRPGEHTVEESGRTVRQDTFDRTPRAGRWPSNLVLSHALLYDGEGVIVGDACAAGCVQGCPVAALDAQSGVLTSGFMAAGTQKAGKPRGIFGEFAPQPSSNDTYGDSGGASRFFPSFRYCAKADRSERPEVDGVAHPTVKPLDLMRWLVRLVTPPGGVVLDPFAGSGTTLEAAVLEGFRAVGVERHAPYLPLIAQRLAKPQEIGLFPMGEVVA